MLHRFRNDRYVAALLVALFGGGLWAQTPRTNETEEATIKRVKSLMVSALDTNLPRVTLEFYLNYEGEGAPIKWSMRNCAQLKETRVPERQRNAAVCVEADIELKDRSATIVIALGAPETQAPPAAWVFSVTVRDPNGLSRKVDRLGDLPMELHRPLLRGPRDIPPPAAGA